jgi:hypothetical protein
MICRVSSMLVMTTEKNEFSSLEIPNGRIILK